jgi:hypothetical protein
MKLTLIKDIKLERGDKNCLTKTFDCSPYVLLDKKVGETVDGTLIDSSRVQLIYSGTTFVIDKTYFKEFQSGSITPTTNKKLYIGIGISVLAIGIISYFVIKNK